MKYRQGRRWWQMFLSACSLLISRPQQFLPASPSSLSSEQVLPSLPFQMHMHPGTSLIDNATQLTCLSFHRTVHMLRYSRVLYIPNTPVWDIMGFRMLWFHYITAQTICCIGYQGAHQKACRVPNKFMKEVQSGIEGERESHRGKVTKLMFTSQNASRSTLL